MASSQATELTEKWPTSPGPCAPGDVETHGDLVPIGGDPPGLADDLLRCAAQRSGWGDDCADQLFGLDVPAGQGLLGRVHRLLVKLPITHVLRPGVASAGRREAPLLGRASTLVA